MLSLSLSLFLFLSKATMKRSLQRFRLSTQRNPGPILPMDNNPSFLSKQEDDKLAEVMT